MKILTQYLAVAAAGSLGAMLRLFVGTACGRLFGTAFPIGTFVINITGCLILGWFLAAIQDRIIVSETLRLVVATGFVGAYTTFSTYIFESNSLLEQGSEIKALANLIGSVIVGLVAVRLGIYLGNR